MYLVSVLKSYEISLQILKFHRRPGLETLPFNICIPEKYDLHSLYRTDVLKFLVLYYNTGERRQKLRTANVFYRIASDLFVWLHALLFLNGDQGPF